MLATPPPGGSPGSLIPDCFLLQAESKENKALAIKMASWKMGVSEVCVRKPPPSEATVSFPQQLPSLHMPICSLSDPRLLRFQQAILFILQGSRKTTISAKTMPTQTQKGFSNFWSISQPIS